MRTLWGSYWKVLILSKEPFEATRQAQDGLWFSIRLFLIVALIASLGTLAAAAGTVQKTTLAERLEGLASHVSTLANQVDTLTGGTLGFLIAPLRSASATLQQYSNAFKAVQPPLGTDLSRIVRLVGTWLATPLVLLGAWMGASLAVWVIAVGLGAAGTLRQHLGLLLLAFSPQILTFFSYIPAAQASQVAWLGTATRLLGVIAFVWSLVIAVRALSIAHGFSNGRALGILVLTAFIFLAVIPAVLAAISGVVLGLILRSIL
jgi:hypothetical protein